VWNRALSCRASIALLAIGIVLLCAAWALLLQLEQAPSPTGPEPFARARTTPDPLAAQFVGSRSCAGCHPEIYREHAGSRHAVTLRPMRRDRLPRGFPRAERFADPETGISYTFTERKGRFILAASAPEGSAERAIDYALGSGKTGMTFVSLEGSRVVRELRMSYFPGRRAWAVTPGQRGASADPIGKPHEGTMAQRCLACHATLLPVSRLAPEEQFLGVGCEACHGPGQAHVTAARAGQPSRGMERLGRWGAARLNHLCGECHRSEQEIDPLDEGALAQTQRFQPYGLMKSACFQKSGDRLSCLSCHNPHQDAARDAAGYERACRSCHAPGATVCPVNARDGCIGCHMPHREVTRGVAMADHWIRVQR
jgi:Cytochrome c554 and c-prime